MPEPKAIQLTQISATGYEGPAPAEMVVVGDIPGEAGGVKSVNAKTPDAAGNVALAAADVAAVPMPGALTAKVVLGTTLSTSELTLVGYSQDPMADQLAMYQFGGQLSVADGAQATDAVNLGQMNDALDSHIEKAGLNSVVYATDGSGVDITLPYATGVTTGLPLRDGGGQITVPEIPTAAGHAASKSYVDGETAGKTQIVALTAVSAADAAAAAGDPPTKAEFDVLVTLANANKAASNAIIAALKA